jgi:outer membrane protein
LKKLSIIFTLPVFLWSQNLNELVNLSLKNHLIHSYEYNVDSLKKEYESAKRGYLPSVDIGASYSATDKETASVPDSGTQTYASVSYTLYDGGKRGDTFKSYESSINSSKQSLASSKNQLALDVITYYYNYLSYIAQKEAKQKEIEQLTAQYNRLSSFMDVGSTTQDVLDKIMSRVESSNVDLQEIELKIQTVVHNLEYITGTKVQIEKGSTIQELINASEESARPDLKALEYNMKTALSNADIEKSGYLPTITLSDRYTNYNYDYDNGTYDYIDNQNIFSVALTWNIFSFGETKSKYESKFKEYLSTKEKYEYEKNKANVDLKLATKAYDIAKLKIKSAQASLKAAQSAYEVIKSKYQNGLIDNVAYLESLTEKYDAISTLKSAKYDLEVKKANIIYNSGEKLKDYIQ